MKCRALAVIIIIELLGFLAGAALWHWAGWSAWTMLGGFVAGPIALAAFIVVEIMRDSAAGRNPFQ